MFLSRVLIFISLCFLSTVSIAKSKKKKASFLPNSFSAKFEQVYKSALSGKEKKSKGSLDYKYPGNIRFITKVPEEVVFVSNQTTTWYYTPPFIEGEPGELTIKESGKNVLSRFFDTLSVGLSSNRYYVVKGMERARKLKFKKNKVKEVGVKEAILRFKSNVATFKDLISVDLTYADNKKVSLKLSNLKIGAKFKKKHFTFKAPKNTKVN